MCMPDASGCGLPWERTTLDSAHMNTEMRWPGAMLTNLTAGAGLTDTASSWWMIIRCSSTEIMKVAKPALLMKVSCGEGRT